MLFKDSGVQALVITNILGNVLRLLSNLVLARFLSPEAFAITGLAATIVFAFNMISDGGFRAFILRHKVGDQDSVLNTLWSVKLLRNVVLIVLLFTASGSIAAFFEISELENVLKVVCLIFLFDAISPISYFLAERNNQVAKVMYIQFSCTVISTVLTVVGVYFVNTYWPIVYGMVLNAVMIVVMGYVFLGVKGSFFAFDRKILVEFLNWAKYIIPSSIVTLILMQLDKLLLGKTLSIEELGLYYIAFNFSAAASTFVIQYARKVLQPYMSTIYRESDGQYLQCLYDKKTNMSFAIAFLIGLLSGCSFMFFDVLYDDRYIEAGYYLSFLLMVPILSLITYPSEVSLILHGKIKMTLIANIIRLCWFLAAALLGYKFFGVLGLLLAIGLIEICPAIYMLYQMKKIDILVLHKELLIIVLAGLGWTLGRLATSLYST